MERNCMAEGFTLLTMLRILLETLYPDQILPMKIERGYILPMLSQDTIALDRKAWYIYLREWPAWPTTAQLTTLVARKNLSCLMTRNHIRCTALNFLFNLIFYIYGGILRPLVRSFWRHNIFIYSMSTYQLVRSFFIICIVFFGKKTFLTNKYVIRQHKDLKSI